MPSFQGQWPAFGCWEIISVRSAGRPAASSTSWSRSIPTIRFTDRPIGFPEVRPIGLPAPALPSRDGMNTRVTWDPNYIRWYIDGNQFSQFYIGGNAGGTNAFNQNNFFAILNLAIGGNWPGFSVNNGALPAKMYVDWIRVYQDGGGLADGRTFRIQARHSGLCLDAWMAGTGNGTPLAQGAWNGGNNQRWVARGLGGNQYAFTGVASGRAIDVNAWSTADIQLQLWDYYANAAQAWVCTLRTAVTIS